MPRHDDAGIPDGAVLIRAIHPDWIIEESGTERLSSATFRDGQQEASCFIADEVGGIAGFCENILPRLSQEFGAELQVATVPVHHVRSSGLWIYRRPEEFVMATRFQPDRDLIVMSGLRTLPLDPSLPPGSRVGAKAGYDLTWPFGQGDRLEVRVPAPPTLAGKRFASVEAALGDGPKFFEELMAAVGSRDGREVVRVLGGLRNKQALDRDGEGRYFIKSGGE